MKKHIAILISLSLAIQPLYPAAEAPPEAEMASIKQKALALSNKLLAKNQKCLETGQGCKPAKREALTIMRDYQAGNTSALDKGLKAIFNTHNACFKFLGTVLGFPFIFAEGAVTGMTKAAFSRKLSSFTKTLASRKKWMADAIKLKSFPGLKKATGEGKVIGVPFFCGLTIGLDILLAILLIAAAVGLWKSTTPSGKRWAEKSAIEKKVINEIMQVSQITAFIDTATNKFKSLLDSSKDINEVISYVESLQAPLSLLVSKDKIGTIIELELKKVRPEEQKKLGVSFTPSSIALFKAAVLRDAIGRMFWPIASKIFNVFSE